MTQYNLTELSRLLGSPVEGDRAIRRLLTDSRTLTPQTDDVLFFALKTRKGDGHKYLPELYDRGVRAFVVSEEIEKSAFPGAAFIRVRDTLAALQSIGRFHRQKLPCPVVGITGSAGKTTIKELLFRLLSEGAGLAVSRSPQSYNSALGVPLSLWQLDPAADLALVEAGISEPGEMDLLRDLIRPDLGLFTGIGEAHGENFPSPLSKAVEKLKLFRGVSKLYLSDDDPTVREALRLSSGSLGNARIIRWSAARADADLFVENLEELPGSTMIRYRFVGESAARSVTVPFHEKGLIDDALLALIFLRDNAPLLFGKKKEEGLKKLFRELSAPAMRMEVIEGEEETLLVLPWGSNAPLEPEPLTNALSFMRKRRLGHLLPESKPTAVVLIDEKAASSGEEARSKEARYRSVSSLIAAQRGADPLSDHKVIAIGEGLTPYLGLLAQAGEVCSFRNVADFLGWRETPAAPATPITAREEGFAAFASSAASVRLRGHLILLLPPFSASGGETAPHHLILETFRKKSHQTILRVNLTALRSNLNALRDLLPDRSSAKVCAMIKAFGYGTGSYEIAKELEADGVEYFAVAVADEGQELREKGIRTPIIVMNPEPSSYLRLIRYRLEPNIYSDTLLRSFGSTAAALGLSDYPVHLSFDTGMHRLGFSEEEIDRLLFYLQNRDTGAAPLRVASIFTHLSKADMPGEDDYTLSQLGTLSRIRERLTAALPYPFLTHALNTAGLMRFPEHALDMVRMGIGLYGLSPLENEGMGLLKSPLRPVASLETVILQTRTLPKGATVGYGNSGLLRRDSRIGVIPIGYADGLPRSLGRGAVAFRAEGGVMVPTVGNICMDAAMLDLTDAPLAAPGTTVTLFGETPEISIDRLAAAENPPLGTIHYEVLARLSGRIVRSYFHE